MTLCSAGVDGAGQGHTASAPGYAMICIAYAKAYLGQTLMGYLSGHAVLQAGACRAGRAAHDKAAGSPKGGGGL